MKSKERLIRDIRRLFKQREKDYYKSRTVGNFWDNNYVEYESSGDRNKKLSVKEHLDKIKPYLRDTEIQKFDT